jgi:hypothetical protein
MSSILCRRVILSPLILSSRPLSPAPGKPNRPFSAVKAYGWAHTGTRRIFLQKMCFAAHFLRKSG